MSNHNPSTHPFILFCLSNSGSWRVMCLPQLYCNLVLKKHNNENRLSIVMKVVNPWCRLHSHRVCKRFLGEARRINTQPQGADITPDAHPEEGEKKVCAKSHMWSMSCHNPLGNKGAAESTYRLCNSLKSLMLIIAKQQAWGKLFQRKWSTYVKTLKWNFTTW